MTFILGRKQVAKILSLASYHKDGLSMVASNHAGKEVEEYRSLNPDFGSVFKMLNNYENK